jgi:hypothetical protein
MGTFATGKGRNDPLLLSRWRTSMDLLFGYLMVTTGRNAMAACKAAITRIRYAVADAQRNRAVGQSQAGR